MTVYKADRKSGVLYITAATILLGLSIALSAKFTSDSWTLLIIFLLLFALLGLTPLRLAELQLDSQRSQLTLIFRNYIGLKRTVNYHLGDLEFTYKRQATTFRGGVKNVCTIYHLGRKVARIGDDDWSEEKIRCIVKGFIEVKIKKKFTGYSLKDAEI